MPNWCSNEVTLSHEDVNKIDDLHDQLEKNQNRRNQMYESGTEAPEVPVLGFLRPRPKTEDENWYGWNTSKWGTKWDVDAWEVERVSENSISFRFDSAWAAPTTLYEYLEEDGWDIDAMYEEPGMCFVGWYNTGYGNEEHEYDFSDPDWREGISEELIDFAGLETAYEDWLEWQEDE